MVEVNKMYFSAAPEYWASSDETEPQYVSLIQYIEKPQTSDRKAISRWIAIW